jgi:hypothetical protein
MELREVSRAAPPPPPTPAAVRILNCDLLQYRPILGFSLWAHVLKAEGQGGGC